MGVGGFTATMHKSTEYEAEWDFVMRGSEVWRGAERDHKYCWTFNEFQNLSDPVIFGMPFISAFDGFQYSDGYCWMGDLYVKALAPAVAARNIPASISRANMEQHAVIGRCCRSTKLEQGGDRLINVMFEGKAI